LPGPRRSSHPIRCFKKIERVLWPEGARSANERNDVEVVAEAAKYAATLVTADGRSKTQPLGILGHREELARAVGVKILSPDEAVDFVREKIRDRDSFNVDTRVKPQQPELVARALAPDYALGAHTASLGVAFGPAIAPGKVGQSATGQGVFVGRHGSWNRKPRSGYKVIFIPFMAGSRSVSPRMFSPDFWMTRAMPWDARLEWQWTRPARYSLRMTSATQSGVSLPRGERIDDGRRASRPFAAHLDGKGFYSANSSRNTSGRRLAIASSERAAPDGLRRPCSHPCSVRVETPNTSANFCCDRPVRMRASRISGTLM
jgi:hypothetical protein